MSSTAGHRAPRAPLSSPAHAAAPPAAPPSAPAPAPTPSPAAAPAPTPASAPDSSPDSAPTARSSAPDLKYLGFLRTAAFEIYFFLLIVYENLKGKAGSLKPGIESVEGSVKTIVGPVVTKLDLKPDEYLKFVDAKVADTLIFAQQHTPVEWKRQAGVVYDFLAKVPENTQAVVEEYNKKGAVATLESYYAKYLPVVLSYLNAIWNLIFTLPLVPKVLAAAQPSIVFIAKQYNAVVADAGKSGVPLARHVSHYLPTIPVEELKAKLKKSE